MMKYAFRMVCSVGASFLNREELDEIVRQAVAEVEKMPLFQESVIFFDDTARSLKIIVRFQKREIHIMTMQEAKDAGLPDQPDHLTASEN
jgi:hypothetical protein